MRRIAVAPLPLLALVSCLASAADASVASVAQAAALPPSPGDATFFIHSVGRRCIDVGVPTSWRPSSPVYIWSCNGTPAQRIRAREIPDGTHDIELRAGDSLFYANGHEWLVSYGGTTPWQHRALAAHRASDVAERPRAGEPF